MRGKTVIFSNVYSKRKHNVRPATERIELASSLIWDCDGRECDEPTCDNPTRTRRSWNTRCGSALIPTQNLTRDALLAKLPPYWLAKVPT